MTTLRMLENRGAAGCRERCAHGKIKIRRGAKWVAPGANVETSTYDAVREGKAGGKREATAARAGN